MKREITSRIIQDEAANQTITFCDLDGAPEGTIWLDGAGRVRTRVGGKWRESEGTRNQTVTFRGQDLTNYLRQWAAEINHEAEAEEAARARKVRVAKQETGMLRLALREHIPSEMVRAVYGSPREEDLGSGLDEAIKPGRYRLAHLVGVKARAEIPFLPDTVPPDLQITKMLGLPVLYPLYPLFSHSRDGRQACLVTAPWLPEVGVGEIPIYTFDELMAVKAADPERLTAARLCESDRQRFAKLAEPVRQVNPSEPDPTATKLFEAPPPTPDDWRCPHCGEEDRHQIGWWLSPQWSCVACGRFCSPPAAPECPSCKRRFVPRGSTFSATGMICPNCGAER